LDAAAITLLEKAFVTNEASSKESGALRSEIGMLRIEMRTELGALRTELHTELGAVRTEMHTELGALRAEVAKIPFETIKWFFTLSGIIAAICFGALRLT
jgi:hypothetical protein